MERSKLMDLQPLAVQMDQHFDTVCPHRCQNRQGHKAKYI